MSIAAAGTTISFAGTGLGKVESITCAINGDVIDGTTLGATRAEFDVGQDDISIEVSIIGNGAHGLSRGDEGTVVLTPSDSSGAQSYANMVVTSVVHTIGKRGQLSSTVTFQPVVTA